MSFFTKPSSKKLFLIDATGALFTAAIVGFLLPRVEPQIGMPKPILKILSIIAFLFFFYTISCYIKTPKKLQFYLKVIAVANLLYCILTGSMILWHFENITLLGKAYFFTEIVIIVSLARIELKYSFKR